MLDTSFQYRLLFNFAASHSSGGYKRLYEYAKWFNANGGACFIIHPKSRGLEELFPANRFFIAVQSRFQRLYDDCGYLKEIRSAIGEPELYYSYGIPIYSRFGKVNWFHLSNVLPLRASSVSLSFADRLKFMYLGRRIRAGFACADVISAESNSSLNLIDEPDASRLFLSVNGSDDELSLLSQKRTENIENIATAVGTYRYKALDEAWRVFRMLKESNQELKLVIIGNEKWVSRRLRSDADVIVLGTLERSNVVEWLRKSKFYLSTTHVENSYNAASEGVFSADESYVSDIGPHRELLANMPMRIVTVPGVTLGLLHVRRDDLNVARLKTWNTVVIEMLERFRQVLHDSSARK